MIRITRLNGNALWINPDMIMTIEANPDTVVSLTNAEKIRAMESPTELMEQFVTYKRQISTPWPASN